MATQKNEPTFPRRVYAVVRTVPEGAVTTYGDVASVLGNPRLARQVGFALARLPDGTDVPWQRVINAGGGISFKGELGRAEEQRQRLIAEGIEFRVDGTCELDRWRWGYPEWRLESDPG